MKKTLTLILALSLICSAFSPSVFADVNETEEESENISTLDAEDTSNSEELFQIEATVTDMETEPENYSVIDDLSSNVVEASSEITDIPMIKGAVYYTAAYAEEFIDAIPAIEDLTLDDIETVQTARTAYDRISAEEQAKVNPEKYAKLVAAEVIVRDLETNTITVGESLEVFRTDPINKIRLTFIPETTGYYFWSYEIISCTYIWEAPYFTEFLSDENGFELGEFTSREPWMVPMTAGKEYQYVFDASPGSIKDYTIRFSVEEAFDVTRQCGESVYWDMSEDGQLIISGSGPVALHDYFGYTYLLPWNNYHVNQAIIASGVTTIDISMFYYNDSLETITIGDTVTFIGDDAFHGCEALQNVEFAVRQTFSGTTIGNNAFLNCNNLSSISLPADLDTIGSEAFDGCTSLTDVYYAGTEEDWNAVNIESGNDPLLQATIHYEASSEADLVEQLIDNIPAVDELTLSDKTTVKKARAAYDSLSSEDKKRINTEKLDKLVASEAKIAELEATQTYVLKLDREVHVPFAQESGMIYAVFVPEVSGYYDIKAGSNADLNEGSGYHLGDVRITDELGNLLFKHADVNWWDSSINYEDESFPYNAYMTAGKTYCIEVDYSTSRPGNTQYYIFLYVTASDKERKCGETVFWDMSEDETLVISGTGRMNTDSIGGWLQRKITHIKIEPGVTSLSEFFSTYTPYAKDSVISIVMSDTVRTIKDNLFSSYRALSEVGFSGALGSIGNYSFSGCTALTSLALPESLTFIGNNAFGYCSSLKSITIPGHITSIGEKAFIGCTSLQSINLPGSLATISKNTFEGCTGLQTVSLEEGVVTIGERAFVNCSGLTEVHLPASLKTVVYCAFEGCNAITDVYFAGSKAEWDNLTIEENNETLTQATIHFALNAASVESLIDALPVAEALTLDDASAVKAVRSAFNRLGSDEQANVSAEKLNKLTAAEAKIAELESQIVYCLVTVTSAGDGISSSIAPVYGGGSYRAGETVTVGATKINGFTFVGWTVDGAIVSTDTEYTFTVEGDTDLVATYQAKNEVSYSLKITGMDFKVNGIPQNNVYYESFKAGTDVVLSYYGNDTFLRWENSSNQPQSVSPSVTLTMNRNYELRVTTVRSIPGDETNGYYAYVEFISPYDQVMSASTWSSKDNYSAHSLPGSVSKSGYTFAGWTMDKESTAGTKDIIAAIDAEHPYIGLTALMEVIDSPRTVTVYDAEGNYTEKQVNLGKTVTLKAGTVSGKIFKCWALDAEGTVPLSYSASYSFKVTTDIAVYAIYVNAGENVTALPVAASTGAYGFTDGGKNKLSFTGNYDVPEGYTVVEYGLLYGTKATEFPDVETAESKLVYESENTYVKKQASTYRLKRDSYEYLINVTGHLDNYVYAKAYLVVINTSTGEQEVYYGKMMYGTYNSLTANGSGGEEDNPEW